MFKDYYKILGITEFETAENIKIAYRKLARKWHPDIAGSTPDTMLKFKEINEAYEILSNKIKKSEYDKARGFYNYANKNMSKKEEKPSNSATNPNNAKNNLFNWDNLFNKKNDKNQSIEPIKGEDVFADIEVSVIDVINGSEKIVNLLQAKTCDFCKGKKFVNSSVCTHCNGKGEILSYKKFKVKIPKGIKSGSKIRLSGEGEKGLNGGKNGDLYIKIKISEASDYKIVDLDIFKNVSISPHDAVLGTSIELSTINGNIKFSIPPNTQGGQKIRLAGCGISQNGQIGDMIITVNIKISNHLTNEEIELYKKLKELSNNISHLDGD